MRIGLVGEAPNDTQAIQNLLEKRFNHDFFFMLRRMTGAKLDCQKTKHFLRLEYQSEKPDLVIFIRDLDALESDRIQRTKLNEYFKVSNKAVNDKGIFLLNIFEIEALILTDLETFNAEYKCSVPFVENPMMIVEPKEYLKEYAKKYSESHNATIFKKIAFDKALTCQYFYDFIQLFETKLK